MTRICYPVGMDTDAQVTQHLAGMWRIWTNMPGVWWSPVKPRNWGMAASHGSVAPVVSSGVSQKRLWYRTEFIAPKTMRDGAANCYCMDYLVVVSTGQALQPHIAEVTPLPSVIV